jgi:hypothetical protein
MSTVYVFGAGASFDAGYPLCSALGSKLLAFMCESINPWIRAAGEFFQDRFGESPNLEDMITAIESRIESLKGSSDLSGRTERGRFANHRGSLAAALREFFGTIRSERSGSYSIFARSIVRRRDTIVTFNYDDALDRELRSFGIWNVSSGYGFPFGSEEEPSQVVLLKLHGSALCANIGETSCPSTITVGRGKKSHLDEHKQDKYFFRCVGSFGA